MAKISLAVYFLFFFSILLKMTNGENDTVRNMTIYETKELYPNLHYHTFDYVEQFLDFNKIRSLPKRMDIIPRLPAIRVRGEWKGGPINSLWRINIILINDNYMAVYFFVTNIKEIYSKTKGENRFITCKIPNEKAIYELIEEESHYQRVGDIFKYHGYIQLSQPDRFISQLDGSLTIKCSLYVLDEEIEFKNEINGNYLNKMHAALTKQEANCWFKCKDGAMVESNRLLLSAQSDVFARVFEEDKTGIINLDDFTRAEVEHMVNYIFSGNVDIESIVEQGNEVNVWRLFDKYDISYFREKMLSYWENTPWSLETCRKIVTIANIPGAHGMTEAFAKLLNTKTPEEQQDFLTTSLLKNETGPVKQICLRSPYKTGKAVMKIPDFLNRSSSSFVAEFNGPYETKWQFDIHPNNSGYMQIFCHTLPKKGSTIKREKFLKCKIENENSSHELSANLSDISGMLIVFDNFIDQNELGQYISPVDGSLTVHCSVHVLEKAINANHFIRAINVPYLLNVQRIMTGGQRKKMEDDCRFQWNDGRKFASNRLLLSAQSDVFRVFFDAAKNYEAYQTGIIRIDEKYQLEDVAHLIHYVTTGEVDFALMTEQQNALFVLMLGDQYAVPQLVDMISTYLAERITLETFSDIVAVAESLPEKSLFDDCLQFFEENNYKADRPMNTWQEFAAYLKRQNREGTGDFSSKYGHCVKGDRNGLPSETDNLEMKDGAQGGGDSVGPSNLHSK